MNFLYDDIVHVLQNTIDSCINSATYRRGGYVLESMFTKFSEITQCNGHYAVQGHLKSPILVPIESPYTTSYLWLILTYVRVSASTLRVEIHDVFAVDRQRVWTQSASVMVRRQYTAAATEAARNVEDLNWWFRSVLSRQGCQNSCIDCIRWSTGHYSTSGNSFTLLWTSDSAGDRQADEQDTGQVVSTWSDPHLAAQTTDCFYCTSYLPSMQSVNADWHFSCSSQAGSCSSTS